MIEDYNHKEYPKTRARHDFWGQVKRTVHGKAVSQEQIDMIVKAIKDGLLLSPEDTLLDIGCGNGALSQYLFSEVSQFHGVDFSEYLIGIAKEYFEKAPDFTFQGIDAVSYVNSGANPESFTKCLCYGAFTYFSYEDSEKVLSGLSGRFRNLQLVYIGNLPDRERAHLFYPEDKDFSGLLDDRNSPIGIWRSKDDFTQLAHRNGWDIDFYEMPVKFYAAHYRYDAILRRPEK